MAKRKIKRKYVFMTAGQRYGRLTSVSFVKTTSYGEQMWLFHCVCGGTTITSVRNARTGHTKSCGCLRRPHGMNRTPEHRAWSSMLSRCHNVGDANYANYGARGIRVCRRWRIFQNFYTDLGARPSDEHSIDRINNAKGYFPDNVRWTTVSEQARNRRSNRFVRVWGKRMTLIDACEKAGINHRRVRGRLITGWAVGRALTVPVRKRIR